MHGTASTEMTSTQSKGSTALSPDLNPIDVQGTPPTTTDQEIVDLTYDENTCDMKCHIIKMQTLNFLLNFQLYITE